MNDRVTEIREALTGLGAKIGFSYPVKELCERYERFQSALAKGVFEKTHAENIRDMYVKDHFKTLAERYGLLDSPCFKRLYENLQRLGYAIGSFKKGASGERESQKVLRTFTYEPGVKFLCNIAIEAEEGKTEYDAIVIAPYGLFIIEMKKWDGPITITEHGILKQNNANGTVYGLAERINVKKDLLKGLLGAKTPDFIQPILVFPDMRTEVDDQYHKIPFCIGGGYPDVIRTYKKLGTCLSNDTIECIYDTLRANHKEQMSYCSIDCEAIIEDYATLMAQIEELACKEADEAIAEEPACMPEEKYIVDVVEEYTPFFARIFNAKNAITFGRLLGAVCIAIPSVSTLVSSRSR